MKDYSYSDIQKASDEVFKMQNDSKFREEDLGKYKCDCRFEKCPIYQSGGNRTCTQSTSRSSAFDDDKLLILALILILSKNSGDKLLIAALLYIIM